MHYGDQYIDPVEAHSAPALSAQEVRSIKAQVGATNAQLAKVIGVWPRSIERYLQKGAPAGCVAQMFRLLSRHPDLLSD